MNPFRSRILDIVPTSFFFHVKPKNSVIFSAFTGKRTCDLAHFLLPFPRECCVTKLTADMANQFSEQPTLFCSRSLWSLNKKSSGLLVVYVKDKCFVWFKVFLFLFPFTASRTCSRGWWTNDREEESRNHQCGGLLRFGMHLVKVQKLKVQSDDQWLEPSFSD